MLAYLLVSGIMLGGKILYIITMIPKYIENYTSINDLFSNMISSGYVFYGGLIGAVLGIFIYSKIFKISFKELLTTLVPVFPLVHAFGRIGCFFAGCCYGMEYHGIGSIIFTSTPFAPTNVELFPSQLVESLCNFIIFFILFWKNKKYIGTYKIVGLYCILYSIVRFILEFFRGDTIRGFIFGLSTSQWISIAILIVGIVIFIRENLKEMKEKSD